jgi:hypothetical protein
MFPSEGRLYIIKLQVFNLLMSIAIKWMSQQKVAVPFKDNRTESIQEVAGISQDVL